ncbi:MAG: hypothetical protein ACI9DC_004718 [Gammaproteobacteria bacterium]|jgi:hypothetical protein
MQPPTVANLVSLNHVSPTQSFGGWLNGVPVMRTGARLYPLRKLAGPNAIARAAEEREIQICWSSRATLAAAVGQRRL